MMTASQRIGDFAKVVSGYAFKSKDFVDHGIPVLKIANIQHEHVVFDKVQYLPPDFLSIAERYHVKTGDVMMSLTGSHVSQPNSVVGRVARYRHSAPALLNQRAARIAIQDEDALDQGFLYYFLRQEKVTYQLAINASGSANQANISPKDVEAVLLPNIGIVEQRRIASVLSAYDDLIENNRQRIALLEEAARLLYKEWFVHLRFPGHEHVKITNDVPEGWKRVELFDEADALYGFAFKSKQFSEDGEGTPVVRIRDIPDGVSKTYTLEEAPKDKLLDDGDFLIGMDGIFHQNYWVGGRAWINQRVVRISSKGVLSNGYLRQAVRKPIEDFNETITGTTVAHLGAKHLKIIKVLVPPKHLLEDANEFFENTRSQFIKLSKQNQELIKARDVLLPRLMDGRLEI